MSTDYRPPPSSGTPSGPAGGILTGTFPNPTGLANGAVATTQSPGDTTTKVATDAFAAAAAAAAIVGLAPLASPAFTGTPTAPTGTTGDSSTAIATDAFVSTAVANAVAGVDPAVAVQAATTAAANTSGWTYNNGTAGVGATFTGAINTAIVIDGFTFTAVGQRLLVKNDTQAPSGAFNGIYSLTALQTVGTGAIFTRASDYNQPADMNNTGSIPVQSGTANGSTSWLLTSQVVTVGTTPLTFAQFTLNPALIAPLASPTFTGNPAAPTQAVNDNSTKLATDAFVTRAALAVYNVKGYGAVGNGSTDDTAAIQAAITAASPGIVYFPPGTYKVSGTLSVTSLGTDFIGAGSTLVTITVSAGFTGDVFSVTNSAFNTNPFSGFSKGTYIEGMTIDGTGAGNGAFGLHWGDMQFGVVDDIVVQNFTGTGSIGHWTDNRYGWMNWCKVRVCAINCTTLHQNDNTGGHGLDNCFNDFYLYGLAQANQNGVVNNVAFYEGKFFIGIQFGTGVGSNTSIALKFGANAYIADNVTIICEVDGSGVAPQTMNFQSSSGLRGLVNISYVESGGTNWVASNASVAGNNIAVYGQIQVPHDSFFSVTQFPGGLTIIGSWTEQAGFSNATHIYLNGGNQFAFQLASGANTVVLTNVITNKAMRCLLLVQQPSSGSAGTIAITGVKTVSGSGALTLSSANSAIDAVELWTPNGSTFYATVLGLNLH